jgi:hypothetical protein
MPCSLTRTYGLGNLFQSKRINNLNAPCCKYVASRGVAKRGMFRLLQLQPCKLPSSLTRIAANALRFDKKRWNWRRECQSIPVDTYAVFRFDGRAPTVRTTPRIALAQRPLRPFGSADTSLHVHLSQFSNTSTVCSPKIGGGVERAGGRSLKRRGRATNLAAPATVRHGLEPT